MSDVAADGRVDVAWFDFRNNLPKGRAVVSQPSADRESAASTARRRHSAAPGTSVRPMFRFILLELDEPNGVISRNQAQVRRRTST